MEPLDGFMPWLLLPFVVTLLVSGLGVLAVPWQADPRVAEVVPPLSKPGQANCPADLAKPADTITWSLPASEHHASPVTYTIERWTGDASCEAGTRQGRYLTENVLLEDGKLVILARRHCDSPTDANETAGWCWGHPRGPQYSVGRAHVQGFGMAGADFEWGFVATVPQDAAKGARSALWLLNDWRAQYCDDTYAEIDVMEWYSSTNDARATTHATCRINPDDTTSKMTIDAGSPADDPDIPSVDWTRPHTWTVKKETDEAQRSVEVSYLLDGEAFSTHSCTSAGLTFETCDAAFSEAWQGILQTAVFSGLSGAFTGPDAAARFPRQRLVISDMWVKPLT
jgi:hypothetical protein